LFSALEKPLEPPFKYHVVVLVPGTDDDGESIKPFPLHEVSEGKELWGDAPFDRIAKSKARQLWTGRNQGQGDIAGHLLFPMDSPFWGGVRRDGVVVACSGFDYEWLDQLVSSLVADTLLALARGQFDRECPPTTKPTWPNFINEGKRDVRHDASHCPTG